MASEDFYYVFMVIYLIKWGEKRSDLFIYQLAYSSVFILCFSYKKKESNTALKRHECEEMMARFSFCPLMLKVP